jgi:hypothetical protein
MALDSRAAGKRLGGVDNTGRIIDINTGMTPGITRIVAQKGPEIEGSMRERVPRLTITYQVER